MANYLWCCGNYCNYIWSGSWPHVHSEHTTHNRRPQAIYVVLEYFYRIRTHRRKHRLRFRLGGRGVVPFPWIDNIRMCGHHTRLMRRGVTHHGIKIMNSIHLQFSFSIMSFLKLACAFCCFLRQNSVLIVRGRGGKKNERWSNKHYSMLVYRRYAASPMYVAGALWMGNVPWKIRF